ncbi:50S ribosomal protein L24 [Candidatus Woesearchaeota archaeon]|nr:50S ribosomal protein L24 [Candidatus Woesearchaeota archaeon]
MWKASKKPSKQRKYVSKAPLHLRGAFLNVHLSAELRKKHSKRSVRVRKGDKIKVLRGTHKGKMGSVESVNVKKSKVYVVGVESIKRDGSKTKYPLSASNLLITDLNINDKKRKENLERK